MKKGPRFQFFGFALALIAGVTGLQGANLAVVGNGASSGPIITTSTFGDIALGTRVRIGKFVNETTLNDKINLFKTSTLDYNGMISWLNDSNNFVDLGTNVTNYGTSAQTGTGVSSSAFVFNTTASLTVNGVTASRNVFNGSISSVNWSSSIGFGTPVYLWVAYNGELGIFRDSGWTTPASDLTALTLNLNTISSAQTGNTEILLGGYQDYATGTDLLVIPEPTSGSLIFIGLGLALAYRFSIRKKIFTKLATIFALALGVPWLVSAQTVSTPIVGFYKKSYPAGGSLQTVGLLKPVAFQGNASTISGAVLTCSNASWVVNAFAPSGGLPSSYVEITSGPLEGYLFDVISNTATTVTVDAAILDAGSNPGFIIRPHTKLSEALSSASNLVDYNDQVTVYNPDASSVSFLRDSSTTTGWVDAGTFSESDAVIYPSQGYVLTTGAAGNYTITGNVKNTATVVPLYPGAVNIVSLSNPGGISKNIQSVGLGAGLADYSDQLATYSNNGTLSTENALIYGGSTDGWLDAGSFAPVSNVSVEGVSPFIVTVTSPSTWKVNAPINQ